MLNNLYQLNYKYIYCENIKGYINVCSLIEKYQKKKPYFMRISIITLTIRQYQQLNEKQYKFIKSFNDLEIKILLINPKI